MVILFSWFSKEFLAWNDCFGSFTIIKKESGTSFWCTVGVWFFHKNVAYLILYLWTKFQCHTFFFSIYKTKCVIKFLFRQFMTSQTSRFIFDHTLKQWPTGTKRGEGRNTQIWISWERKKLFRWNEKHF